MLYMTGADAGCWTSDYGGENALLVNEPAWRMWRLNITGALRRSSGLKVSAMDQITAGCIKWGSQGQFRIRIADSLMMRAGSIISVLRDMEMMIDL